MAASCGRERVLDLGEFESYVKTFEQDSIAVGTPVKVDDLRIQGGPLEYGRIAACWYSTYSVPTITVNSAVWPYMTEVERQATLHHELGHCVLRRKHRHEAKPDGTPLSLMHPEAIDPDTYLRHQTYYIKELFLGEKLPLSLDES